MRAKTMDRSASVRCNDGGTVGVRQHPNRRTDVQVVDLRPGRRGAAPAVEVWDSPAAELLRIASALADHHEAAFDVGDNRLEQLRQELPDELRAGLGSFRDWLMLTRLVSHLPAPGTVADLLALLERDPTVPWRILIAGVCDECTDAVDEAAVEAYIADEDGAADVLRTHLVPLADDRDSARLVEQLLSVRPEQHGQRVAALLRGLLDGPGEAMLVEAAGPIGREVAARRAELEGGRPVGELIVDATNGYELSEDMPVDRVLLVPSYWFRPWLIIVREGTDEVLTSPVADERLSLPSQAPPPSLVKLCKALGDDGRLRLLRQMAVTPITLADAMAELDVAKTTAHHHLAILRQAGLVVVRGEGRATSYALRTSPPAAAASALEEYLGPTAALAAVAPSPQAPAIP